MDTASLVPRWWRLAGLITWVVVGGTFLVDFAESPGLLHQRRVWALGFVYVLFAVLFAATAAPRRRLARPTRVTLILVQAGAAFLIAYLPQKAVGFIFLVLVAGQLGTLLAPRPAILWIVAQSTVMAWIYHAMLPLQLAVAYIGVYLGFEIFAYLTVRAAESEACARQDLARVNAELRSTQAMLAEHSRVAERMRIARELHDVLGHDLTVLCLNLEVARHLTDGDVHKHVSTSHALARRLLADVRGVVSDLRGDGVVDLKRATRALVEAVPRPQIHVALADDLHVEDPVCADAMLRCTQEIVTNAIRHAGADNLWLEFS
ncbi:MAG: histidine kinase, partial [Planctomycetota bacterium]